MPQFRSHAENFGNLVEVESQLQSLKTENAYLKERNAFLEASNQTLANDLQQEALNAEQHNSELQHTLEKLENLQMKKGSLNIDNCKIMNFIAK